MKYVIFFILVSMGNVLAGTPKVENIARLSLEKNIIHLKRGEFLAAGAHQFKSLWTRDFCFSTPALLSLKKYSLVKNHLNYLISNRRDDGLVPIYADSINPMQRVALASVNRVLGIKANYDIKENIKPYYKATEKFPTIDANILVLKASYEYYQASHDEDWWQKNQKAFREIYNYYENFFDDGLISQGAYSDWQDSSKRKGKTFFTNLLYLDVSKSFHYLSETETEALTFKIHQAFFDKTTGLYFSIKDYPYISLDGILWALDKKLMPNSDELYLHLREHPLWNRYKVPGFVTTPSYPKSWINPHVRMGSLSEYHGNLSWSWLMAYSSTVALKYGDVEEAKRLRDNLSSLILRDGTVGEIYYSNNYQPFKSMLYQSEAPFSWGAAFVVEMLKQSTLLKF